jgi:hypothetical protein
VSVRLYASVGGVVVVEKCVGLGVNFNLRQISVVVDKREPTNRCLSASNLVVSFLLVPPPDSFLIHLKLNFNPTNQNDDLRRRRRPRRNDERTERRRIEVNIPENYPFLLKRNAWK